MAQTPQSRLYTRRPPSAEVDRRIALPLKLLPVLFWAHLDATQSLPLVVSFRLSSSRVTSGPLFALVVGAAVAGAGSLAQAEPARKTADFTVRVDQAASSTGGTSLTWDARKGRWGMTFNVEAPKTREPDWTDVEAGAYYRVSPSLRIGGAVSLGDQAGQPEAWRKIAPQQPAPRVRLETAFKF